MISKSGWLTKTATLAILMSTSALMTLTACSSTGNKAEMPASANPTDEVARLESDINKGYEAQYDILAPEEFNKAQKGLEKVKESIKDEDKQEKVIDRLAVARGQLNTARDMAQGRQATVQGILDARQNALAAGARKFPKENNMLKDIDDDFRDQAPERSVKPKVFADLQSRYLGLELSAIQTTQLGKARAAVANAKNNGASKNTPRTLNQAELAITNAENQIAANRNNPANFQQAVTQANDKAALLVAVLAATKRPDGIVASEEVALSLVNAGAKIAGLSENLGEVSGQVAEKDAQLADQNAKLKSADTVMSLDAALEEGRKQFSKDEADVYRQGKNLIIRLKKIEFATGNNALPASSLDLLAKVRSVAQDLNPSQVVVQGHTDSVGTPQVNMALSQARAQAVASYLAGNGIAEEKVQAVGYGFKQPLASNKTKAGRAQNRRVDVVITPGAAPAM